MKAIHEHEDNYGHKCLLYVQRMMALFYALSFLLLWEASYAAADTPLQRIDSRTLYRMLENREPLLMVHVGGLIACQDGRIPGSLCLPCGDTAMLSSVVLPKSRDLRVVFYTTGAFPEGNCPVMAALGQQGYAKMYIFGGGMTAWRRAGYPTESPGRIPRKLGPALKARDVPNGQGGATPYLVVDIRPAAVFRSGAMEGAVNVPMEELHRRYLDLPLDRPLLIVDEDGTLAFLAVSYLQRKGFRNVKRLEGGMASWRTWKKRADR